MIAHAVGHHVQNVLEILPKAQEVQRALSRAEANHIQVQVELQADCLVGVWARRENEHLKSHGKLPTIEPGDIEAITVIGDDTQRKAHVVPDSFTHGSSEQRQRWLGQNQNPLSPHVGSGQLRTCPPHWLGPLSAITGREQMQQTNVRTGQTHSITSSARALSVVGTSMSSTLAVFMLTTRSNLVGA
jgi:hypothetical protein